MINPPRSVLVVGSGVFGLTTAASLARHEFFNDASITVIDNGRGQLPPDDCASVDSSRIIRADYSDPHYSSLAAEAQLQWRQNGDHDLGGQGRYTESGFVLAADEPKQPCSGKMNGMDYVKSSWDNVVKVTEKMGLPKEKIRVLDSLQALKNELNTAGRPGDWGYFNGYSGWADAGASIRWYRGRVEAETRVNFVDAQVERLLTEGRKVTGVRLKDGRELKADLVVMAAGAWCTDLVDLRGRVEATGHILGYLDITDEEQAVLGKRPTVLNLTSGLFIITPKDNVLKIARHGYGYLNPEVITTALPPSPDQKQTQFVASRPYTARDGAPNIMPYEADQLFRKGLRDLIPGEGIETRPWRAARVCWYSDTRDADWLIDWHPGWEGLFIATGDSGHGFKFLPVIGDKIVNCMLGKGGELGAKWRWKEIEDDGVGCEVDGVYNGLITEDGSRGGKPGMLLKDEMARLPAKL